MSTRGGSAPAAAPEHQFADQIRAELFTVLGEKRYTLWIDGKVSLAIHDDVLTVGVGSPFLLTWMQRQFKTELADAAQRVLGPSARVCLVVDAVASAMRAQPNKPVEAGAGRSVAPRTATELREALGQATGLTTTAGVQTAGNATENATGAQIGGAVGSAVGHSTSTANNPSSSRSGATGFPLSAPARGRRLADLADFVAGPQTELALTAARQIGAGQPTLFNPFYIHGPVGSGKTHLLEGICRQLKRTHPAANVMLITSEAFANYFTQALRDRTLPGFRQRFRGVDVLLVDDVDFFESKRVFQEEFLHTFAELVDHGRQVVLSGSRHPRLLTKLGDDLATRFLSGLVCRLDIPDAATRLAIVRAKAARLSGDFAPEALQYVAQRFQSNVRELEGALNCLQTFHGMTGKRVTLSAARQTLADLERDCLRIVRLTDIERVVCNLFGVKPRDLQSESRVRTVAQPRMLAMFLARKHTQSAYTEIGQHFGGRNHSTVMSAERKVQQWLDENATIQVAAQTWTIGEILSTLEQQLLAG